MANYSRASVEISYGATSALQDPDFEKTLVSVPTDPTHYKQMKMTVATGGETIDLSEFTAIDECYIENQDATNYVTAVYRTTADTSNNNTQRILKGQWIKIALVHPATDLLLTANTAACICTVICIGT